MKKETGIKRIVKLYSILLIIFLLFEIGLLTIITISLKRMDNSESFLKIFLSFFVIISLLLDTIISIHILKVKKIRKN